MTTDDEPADLATPPAVAYAAFILTTWTALVDACAGIRTHALEAGFSVTVADAMACHVWNIVAPTLAPTNP